MIGTSVDTVAKLIEEAAEEAEHKGRCDYELATNEHTRKKKTEAFDVLHAENDAVDVIIEQLNNEIAEWNQAVAKAVQAIVRVQKAVQPEIFDESYTGMQSENDGDAVLKIKVKIVDMRSDRMHFFDKPYWAGYHAKHPGWFTSDWHVTLADGTGATTKDTGSGQVSSGQVWSGSSSSSWACSLPSRGAFRRQK